MSDTDNNWNQAVGTQQNDFEPVKFSDLEVDEVFWINNSPNGIKNQIWRKDENTKAFNLRGGESKTFKGNTTFYMRV